jgi:hypothetical protein
VAIVVTDQPAVASAIELFRSMRDAATGGRQAAAGAPGEIPC